jgi:hypothetical protein
MPTRTRALVARLVAAITVIIALAGCTPEQVIRFVWRDDPPATADQAVAVADCESNLEPDASSGPNLGLFQINWSYHGWRWPDGDPYDPLINSVVAHGLWLDQGWRPWSCRWAAG